VVELLALSEVKSFRSPDGTERDRTDKNTKTSHYNKFVL
jgi:hypothetical protein